MGYALQCCPQGYVSATMKAHYPLAVNWTRSARLRHDGFVVLIYVQCAACKAEAPATDNDGKPDIPEDWRALWAESNPTYELYACSAGCRRITSYALLQSYPEDHVMERRVECLTNPA